MPEQSPIELNKMTVRGYLDDVFNAHKPEAADGYLAPEVTWHGGVLGTVDGLQNVKDQMLHGFFTAFPDLRATERDVVAEGDTVAMRLSIQATQQGDLFGIPATGRTVQWDAVDVYRLSSQKIVEQWAAEDVGSIFAQLGQYSPPWLT